ncbi:MAG: NUDIX domain-containing protein, partial [Clostridia bacterium]
MNKRECTSRAIIPIEKDGRKYILSMKREKKRNGKKEVYFSLPGGHLEDRESFEEAAIREVEEEFGIKIAIKELLCHIYVEELKRDEKFFICNYISGEIRKGNGEE